MGMKLKILAWPARKNAGRNPYQRLLYDNMETETGSIVLEFSPAALLFGTRPDILHLHWPDVFVAVGQGWRFWGRCAFLRLLLFVARLRGTKVIWTAHNLMREGQQNSIRLARWFWPWFLHRVDGIIFMTKASVEVARSQYPALDGKAHIVIPHGDYLSVIGSLPQAPSEDEELPQILFFGSISTYKNAWKVLEAFLSLPPGRARLRISGKMSLVIPDRKLETLLASMPDDRRKEVLYEDRFLPDEELVKALVGADLVVFPYSDVLNSGAAIFAFSAGRPILASDTALFRELQTQVGPEWVRLICGDLDASQLDAALCSAQTQRESMPDLSTFNWKLIARQTAHFFVDRVKTRDAISG